jgi:hypothetical protein
MKRRAAALLNDVNASAHVIEQLIWIWLPSALHVAQRIGQRGNGATEFMISLEQRCCGGCFGVWPGPGSRL